ncbi:HYR domain-containing protein, partial [Mangrovibacterium marinum]|uniref:HYR domain-containing protein n=1 Tax=Mangrovibacterium marinum TaxID=1639118 RepID=UPI0014755EEA
MKASSLPNSVHAYLPPASPFYESTTAVSFALPAQSSAPGFTATNSQEQAAPLPTRSRNTRNTTNTEYRRRLSPLILALPPPPTATGGDWNTETNWNPTGVPTSGDVVTIPSTVTMSISGDAYCSDLIIESGGTLNILDGGNLIVAGSISINNGGTLTTYTGSTITAQGNWTNNGTFDARGGTVTFNTAGSQITGSSPTAFASLRINAGSNVGSVITVSSDITVSNLSLQNGLLSIIGGTTDISNTFSIPREAGLEVKNGATLNTGNFTINNKGLIRVDGGTANFGDFDGNSVEINTDGAFVVQNSSTVNVTGRLHNSAGGTLPDGGSGIPSGITVSGGTVNLATVGNGLSGAGALNVTQQGAFSFTGGTINIINANSTSGTAVDLAIAEEDGNGTKTITNGVFHFGDGTANTYQIISAIDIPHITTTNLTELEITRTIGANGTYTFNLSDGSGNEIPVEITISADSYASDASIKVTTTDGVFEENESDVNYLSRYWTVELTGITTPNYSFTADYRPTDIVGTESEIAAGAWTGALPWTKGNVAGGNTITFSGLTGDVNITGITADDPTVTASVAPNPVCEGSDISLSAIPTGDAPFTYEWTGPNSFTSTDQNPTRTNLSTADAGDYTVTVTDGNGFTASDAVSVTVNTMPAFTACPSSPVTVNTIAGTCAATAIYTVAATGTPAPDLTYSFSAPTSGSGNGTGSGSTFNLGTTTVTVTATNSCGSVDCVFDVEVSDDEDPNANCQNLTVQLDGSGNATITPAQINNNSSDNCTTAANLTFALDQTSFDCNDLGANIVTLTVTDESNNSSTCTATVTVQDQIDPVITCPGNINQTADAGNCGAVVNFTATATDNCSATITYSQDPLTVFPVGTTTVTATATDPAGNTDQCSFDITVTDDEDPVITCPATITVNNDAGQCGAIVNYPLPVVSDNCSGVSTVKSDGPDSGTLFPVGTTSVTYRATDAAGNVAECSFTVTVNDNEDPTVNCPSSYTATGNSACTGTVDVAAPDYSDNCEVTSFSWTMSGASTGSGNTAIGTYTFNRGTTTIEYTVRDAAGNQDQCSYDITIPDLLTASATTPASVLCAGDLLTLSAAQTGGTSNYTYSWSGPNNFSSTLQNPTINNISTAASGSYSVEVTDANNCTATASVSVTVRPTPTATISGTIQVCRGTSPLPMVTISNPMDLAVVVRYNVNGSVTTVPIDPHDDATISQATSVADDFVYTLESVEYSSVPACPNPITGSATITVYPTPTVDVISDKTYCNNVGVPAISITGPVAGTSFSWTNSNPSIGLAANGSGNIPTFTPTNATNSPVTATITVTPTANGCVGTPRTFTITVNPTATATIGGTTTVCQNDESPDITFTNPLPLPVTVTYRKNSVDQTPINVAANGSATVAVATSTAGTFLYELVTVAFQSNPACSKGVSGSATVTVTPRANVVATPASQGICSTEAIETIVLTSSTPGVTSFDWTRNNTGTVTGIAASGSGNISGTLTNTTSSPVIVTFTITATTNGCAGTPVNATVTVYPTPIATVSPLTQTRCSGIETLSTITPSSTTGNTTFSWTRDKLTEVTGLDESGTGSVPIVNLTNTTSAPVTVTFTFTPTANNCEGPPVTATAVINPTPNINDSTITICNSGSFDVLPVDGPNGVVPAGTNFSWKVQSSTAGITGATSSDDTEPNLSITGTLGNTTNTTQSVTYSVTPSFNGCIGGIFKLTVNVTPEPDINDMSRSFCSDNGFNVAPANGTNGIVPSGTTYVWDVVSAGGNISGEGAGSGSSISGLLSNSGNTAQTVVYNVTPTAGSCGGDPFTLTVTVNPVPDIDDLTEAVCTNAPFSVTPAHGTDGNIPSNTTYSWGAPVVTGGMTGGTIGSGAISISGTLTNVTSSPQTATYTVTPLSGSCAGTPFDLVVTVNPKPAISPLTATICSGESFDPTLADGTNGTIPDNTTYTWSAPSVSGISGTSSGTNASAFTSGTLVNSTTTAKIVSYSVTPTSAEGCPGSDFTVSVTVNPEPSIPDMTAMACSGVAFSVTPVNVTNGIVPSGTSYSWVVLSDSGGTGAAAGTGSTIGGTLVNSSTTVQTVVYEVTPTAGTCDGSTFELTVTVKPVPDVEISGGATVCANVGNPQITFTNNVNLPVTITYNIDGGTDFTVDIDASSSVSIPATINAEGTFDYNLVSAEYQDTPACSTPIGESTTIIVEPITTVAISRTPTGTICWGESVTFSSNVANEGAGATYQWQISDDGGVSWSNIPGENGTTFTSASLDNAEKIKLVVTTSDTPCPGAIESNVITMTVNPSYTTSVTISEDANDICDGTTVNFTSTVVNGGAAPSYQWKINDVDVPGATSSTFSSSSLNEGDEVTLMVTASGDICTLNNGEATSDPVLMVVNANQTVSVDIAASADPVCSGSSVTFTATPTNGGLIPTYQWYVDGSPVGTNSSTYTYTPSDDDVVTVDLTASSEICTLDEEATDSYTIQVDPLPTASAGGSAAICEDDIYTLSSGEATATNYSTISWTENGAGNITADVNTLTPTYTAAAADAGKTVTLTMTVTGDNTCGTATATATYSIQVDPLPTASAGGSATICENGSYTLSSGEATATNYASVSWAHDGNGSISNGTTLTPTYTPAAGDVGTPVTLTMTVTSNNTCGSTATATYTVNVDPLPTASAGGNATICSDETYTLTSGEASAAYGTISWTENGAGSITAGATTETPTYEAAVGDAGKTVTLTMTVSSNNACAPATATANYTINVSPLPPATPGIIAGNSDVCNDNTEFTYSIAAVTDATTYTWTVPSGWTITGGQGTTSITVEATATAVSGNISVTAGNSCGTSTASLFPVNVVTSPPAIPGAIDGLTAICPTLTTVYTTSGATGADYYTWTVPTGWTIDAGQGTTSITVTVPIGASSGNVTVTANNVCGPGAVQTHAVTVAADASVYAGPDQIVCQGESSVELNGQVDGAVSPNKKSEWDWVLISGGTLGGDKLQTTYNFPDGFTTGVLYVVLQSNLSVVGCEFVSDTMKITVLAYPTAEAGGPDVVCQSATPSPITLSSSSVGGGATTGAWSIDAGGGSLSSTAQTASPDAVTYTPAANFSGTVTLRLTTNAPGGCSAATDTRTITVDPLPTASAAGSATICENSAYTLSAGEATASNYTTISWDHDGSGSITNGSSLTPTYTAAAGDAGKTVTLTMTVTGNNACGSATATATYSIQVDPLPTASAGGSQAICVNETATVSGASANNGSILWSHDGSGSLSNANTLTPTYTPAAGDAGGTVTLEMTVSSLNSCSGETATASYTVQVDPLPVAIAGGSTTICVDETATVSEASANNSDVLWTHDGTGTLTDETSLTPSYTSAAGDAGKTVTLTMTVTSTNNCAGETATASYTVNVDPLPTASAGGSATICVDDTYTLSSGEATASYGTILWTADGAGSITAGGTTLTPTYTPAVGDAGEIVTLTMTVTSNGNCGTATDTYTITVDPLATVDAGPDQTICQGDAALLAGGFGGSAVSASWTGGTGTFSTNRNDLNASYTPSNAEITAGSVTLTLTTNVGSSPCDPVSDAITITIRKKVVITSQPSNTGVCVGESASLTVVAVGDGLTYQWYKGSSPISGATSATLTFGSVALTDDGSYYVVVSGLAPCSSVQSATVTLNVDEAITITTPPASITRCEGANVSFGVVADAGGVPLTYQWRKGGVAIGGATASSYTLTNISTADAGNYDVVISGPSGFTCSSVTSNAATLTVNTNGTISDPANKNQTVCIDVAITDIDFTVGGSATNVSLSGALPDGVSGSYNSGTKTYTISGTPTEAGTFNYTVTTTGSPCVNPSVSGTITVDGVGTINLGGGTATQTVCKNTPIGNISYLIGGNATGAEITAGSLPGGVTGLYSSATGLFTISGTPTVAGTFPFTVSTTGSPCANPSLSGSISVTDDATIALTSGDAGQSVCIYNPIEAISYTIGGSATGVVLGGNLPDDVSGNYDSATKVYTISGAPSESGSFNYSLTTTGPCANTSLSGSIQVDDLPDGGFISPAISTACTADNTGTLTLESYVGNVIQWEMSLDGGATWDTIHVTTDTYTYNDIPNTALFTALVGNDNCTPVYSGLAKVGVVPEFTPVITASGGDVCSGEPVTLTGTVPQIDFDLDIITGGDFNNANPKGWVVYLDGVPYKNFPASNDNERIGPWAETNGPKTFCGGHEFDTADNTKFAITSGGVNSWMETPVFSLPSTMSSAELTFKHAYMLDVDATARIMLSTDGGNNYTIPLASYSGNLMSGMPNVINDVGVDLSSYIGTDNLRIRFEFDSPTECSVWAVDNIGLPSPPPDITYQWGPIDQIPGGSGEVVVVLPPTTTEYTLTVFIAGCPGSATEYIVSVINNPVVTTTNACVGGDPVTFYQTEAPDGGTWTVTGGGFIDNNGVFTATEPGCFEATYTTLAGGCEGTASFVVFPAAPTPTVNEGCGPIVVTPPTPVYGFDVEYSFNDGATWGANTPPTADNCDGYRIRTRYRLAIACDTIPANEVSGDPVCSASPAVTRRIDSEAPIFTVPADKIITKDADCNYDASTDVTGDVTDEHDNCSTGLEATYSDVVIPGSCDGEVIIERTWFLEDDCGNQTVQIQTITVADNNLGPTFTAPADITIYRDASCNYDATITATGDVTDEADNCDTSLDATFTDVVDNSDPCSVIITRTWSLTDDCDNTTTHDQIITVADDIAPTISCPADVTVQCTADIPAVNTSAVSATDNCAGPVTVTHIGDVSDDNSCPEVITRTYRATDGCGNYVECTQTITVDDTTAPVFSPLAANGQSNCVTADPNNDSGYQNWLSTRAGAAATDNCDSSLDWTDNSASQTWGGTPANQQITITWIVTDDCGNSASTSATYTITDDVAPTITCPGNVQEVAAPNNCSKTLASPTNATMSDDCSTPTLSYSRLLPDGTTDSGNGTVTGLSFPVGVTTVTYTATDAAGLTADCSFTVTIVDVTPPSIEIAGCQDVEGTMDATDCYAIPPTLVDPIYSDDCWPLDSLDLTFEITGAWDTTGVGSVAGFSFPVGVSNVEYTVTDPDGNDATCSFTVTMLRDEIPYAFIDCPSDPDPVTLGSTDCEATLSLDPPTIDDYCVTATYTITNDYNNGPSIVNETFPVGTTEVTWTIRDNSGNETTCVVTVEVIGTALPSIDCPDDVEGPMTEDDCEALPPVLDPPTYSAPCWPNDSLELSYSIVSEFGGWTASGDGLVPSDLEFPVGQNTVTYTVTDPDGNSANCSFTVTMLQDDISWTVYSCPPASVSQTLGATDCETTLSLPAPTINDHCVTATYTITNDYNGGASIVNETFPVGTTEVTWTIRDNSGNETTCVVTVEVIGTALPSIDCPDDVEGTMTEDNCEALPPVLAPPTYSAPCWPNDSLELSYSIVSEFGGWTASGDGLVPSDLEFPVGQNTVTYTVTDPDGNSVNCSFTVTMLQDDISWTVYTCPSNPADVTVDAVSCDAPVTVSPPTINDHCVTANYTITHDSPYGASPTDASGEYPIGVHTVTWTISDNSGNETSCVQTFEVIDRLPSLSCPPSITVPADLNQTFASGVDVGLPSYADNCDSTLIYTVLDPSGSLDSVYNDPFGINLLIGEHTYDLGVTTITYYFEDGNGHQLDCSFTVTVTGPPVIECPPDTTVYADANCEHIFDPGFAKLLEGVPEIEWTFTITDPDGSTGLTRTYTKAVFEDADPIGNYAFQLGTSTISWSASNLSGSDQCSHIVAVIDTTPPEVTCVARNLEGCDTNVITGPAISETTANSSYAEFINATNQGTATDNCSIAGVEYVDVVNGSCPIVVTRTWTVYDGSGNSASCDQTINVDDTTDPTITAPTALDLEGCATAVIAASSTLAYSESPVSITLAEYLAEPGALAADNCEVDYITYMDATDNSSCPETITRTFTVYDLCGNSATADQTITIDDTTNPTASNPETVIVQCIGDVPSVDITVVTDEADNCTANPVVAWVSDVSDNQTCPETITRTYSVTDDCGNQILVTQTITVDDDVLPTITCPGNLTAVCDINEQPAYADYTAFVNAGGSASDNCGIDESSFTHVGDVSDNASCPETITRTYQIADLCGNVQTCTQLIVIDDEELPSITCPDNLTAVCAISEQPAYTTFAEFTTAGGSASDNCGIDESSFTHVGDVSNGSTCPETITRTYQIADLCGNLQTCTQLIVIDDEELPSITCPGNLTAVCAISEQPAYTTFAEFTTAGGSASDNCGIDESSFAHVGDVSDGNSCPETITRTYQIADLCGNVQTCEQLIVIDDEELPSITCPGNLTAVCAISEQPAYTTFAEFTTAGGLASDNCGIDESSFTHVGDVSDGNSCPETITRTYQIADLCGNVQTCEQLIVIDDEELPSITCPGNLTAVCAISEQPAYTTFAEFTTAGGSASDNCGIDESSFTH